jgi:hypothetical protein
MAARIAQRDLMSEADVSVFDSETRPKGQERNELGWVGSLHVDPMCEGPIHLKQLEGRDIRPTAV